MELLNILIGVVFLTVIYALIDNFNLRVKVHRQQAVLNEYWIGLSALKDFTVNATADLRIKIDGESATVDALVDALGRFDDRLALLEPRAEAIENVEV